MAQGQKDSVPLISKDGSELVLKLYNAIRSLMSAQHDLSVLRDMVGDLLRNGGKLSLLIDRDRFFLNENRIEMRSGHAVHKILLAEFKKRRISRIDFAELPDPRDLERFLRSLMGMSENGENNGEILQGILAEKKIESVRVEGERPGADGEDMGSFHASNVHHTRIYFYTMQLVKQLFVRAERNKSLDLSLTRQVIRTLVSGYADLPATFMGLATIKTSQEFLANHCVNVAIYAIALGHRLGLRYPFLVDLGLAALLHDIGESRLASAGETTPQELTDQEWKEANNQLALGVKIITGASGSNLMTRSRAMAGIFDHHLRYDLSGFPKLRKKRNITLVGKIVALADFYDLAARPYGKNHYPCFSDRLLGLIVDRSGRDFDPVLAKYFVRVLGMFPVGTLCRLDTGELGIVSSVAEEGTTGDRPWVRLLIPAERHYMSGDSVSLEAVDERTGRYRRSLLEILDPNELGIDVAEYLIEF